MKYLRDVTKLLDLFTVKARKMCIHFRGISGIVKLENVASRSVHK